MYAGKMAVVSVGASGENADLVVETLPIRTLDMCACTGPKGQNRGEMGKYGGQAQRMGARPEMETELCSTVDSAARHFCLRSPFGRSSGYTP